VKSKNYFDGFNRVGVAHECDRQTDRETDRSPLAIACSNIDAH